MSRFISCYLLGEVARCNAAIKSARKQSEEKLTLENHNLRLQLKEMTDARLRFTAENAGHTIRLKNEVEKLQKELKEKKDRNDLETFQKRIASLRKDLVLAITQNAKLVDEIASLTSGQQTEEIEQLKAQLVDATAANALLLDLHNTLKKDFQLAKNELSACAVRNNILHKVKYSANEELKCLKAQLVDAIVLNTTLSDYCTKLEKAEADTIEIKNQTSKPVRVTVESVEFTKEYWWDKVWEAMKKNAERIIQYD